MTVKTTLSFTDRHHKYLTEKVSEGVFASQSSAVAAAIEQMMQDEEERDLALASVADEIRSRLETPLEEYLDHEEVFAAAYAAIDAARGE